MATYDWEYAQRVAQKSAFYGRAASIWNENRSDAAETW
jgi:hypothetical protein